MISYLTTIYRRWFTPSIEKDDLLPLRRQLAFQNYRRMRILAVFMAVIMAVFLVVDIFVINHYRNERIVDFMILLMADRLLIIGASTFFALLTGKAENAEKLKPSQYKAAMIYLFFIFNCMALISVFLIPLKPGMGAFMMAIIVLTALFRLPGKISFALFLPTMVMVIIAIVCVQENYLLKSSDILTVILMSACGIVTMRILYCDWLRNEFNQRLLERQNIELSHKNLLLSENRQDYGDAYYFDSQTGIPNRIRFMELFKVEWKRAQREKKPISIIVADIEQFSSLNARMGRKTGDEYLEKTAGALKTSVMRPGDVVARFGDDEFIIMLPDTGERGAATVAERMNRSVESLSLAHPTSECGILKITIGHVSITPDQNGKPEDAVRLAFNALWPQEQ